MNNKIKFSGELTLAGITLPCYVTEDGTRLLSGSKTQLALKITEGERQSTKIDKFMSQKAIHPITSALLSEESLTPIECYQGDRKVYCYHAETLNDICDAMLEARKTVQLTPRQKIVADQCEILMRGFARVGITALVDEATGYQAERDNTELQKILAAYISDEVAKWQLTFSSDFYKEMFRLWNINFDPCGNEKPLLVGSLTNNYVYKQLPNGVLTALKEKTGKTKSGYNKNKFHQHLTQEVGRQDLKRIINEVTALMAVSDSKEQFKILFDRRYNRKTA